MGARLRASLIPRGRPGPGVAITLAALLLIVESVLVVLLKQVEPNDPVGIIYALLMGVALVGNFVAGFAAVRVLAADRRREADLAAELAHLMLRAGDLNQAADEAARHLAGALRLPSASVALTDTGSNRRGWAIPLRDDDQALGVLELPDNLSRATRQRLLRVVPTLAALLSAAREREDINKKLIASHQRLEQFFDLSSDLMVICDRSNLLQLNPAFERTLGYTVGDSAPAPGDLVLNDDTNRLRERFHELLDGRGPVRYESRVTSHDGSLRWIEWTVAAQQHLFYAVGRDVTEQRAEQEQLRQTQTMLRTSRDELRSLAEQQAALRRIATLVARGASPAEVFSAVAEEMGRCLGVAGTAVSRLDGHKMVLLALSPVDDQARDALPIGGRLPVDGDNVVTRVIGTGRAARMDSQENATGAVGELLRALGVRSVVGVPIIVDGNVWGMATAGTGESATSGGTRALAALPADTEHRLADFADLVATALANAATKDALQASRDSLGQLARQQTALRRVAELVAREAEPVDVFTAVAEEMADCLDAHNATVARYEGDAIVIAAIARREPGMPNPPAVGERFAVGGDHVAAIIQRTGQPARIDSHQHAAGTTAARIREVGVQSVVGVPIVVGEQLWGVAAVTSTQQQPLPADTEARITDFADLVATVILNAATRAELQASRDNLRELADNLSMLARQQTALRRVATLVARGVSQSELFSAVAEEMARCLSVTNAHVNRYEDDGATVVVVASHAAPGVPHFSVGERLPIAGDNVSSMVFRTGQPARMDSYAGASGILAERVRELGLQSGVGAPIVVNERIWGLAIVDQPGPLAPETEGRIAEFAELVATAIAAATTRAELIASRARIVAAADDARRRLERDIHDGAQQRLVALGLKLRLAEVSLPPEREDLKDELSGLVSGLTDVTRELQELSRGIHPAMLSRGGLPAAFKMLARRSALPVQLDVGIEQRLPDSVEVAAYYVAAEALTNAVKHAHATEVKVLARVTNRNLSLSICDDGIGGADPSEGSGLVGIRDRVEVLGGHMQIASPPGGGTTLYIVIPTG